MGSTRSASGHENGSPHYYFLGTFFAKLIGASGFFRRLQVAGTGPMSVTAVLGGRDDDHGYHPRYSYGAREDRSGRGVKLT